MAIVYISIGSNIEPKESNLNKGCQALAAQELITLVDWSSLYQTKAITTTPQPDFYNAAVKIETALLPHALLRVLLKIEHDSGRIRVVPNSPRPLDLDILLYEQQVIHDRLLQIPHPRMTSRAFVLVPLAEIAAEVTHPLINRSISSLLTEQVSEGVHLLAEGKNWLHIKEF